MNVNNDEAGDRHYYALPSGTQVFEFELASVLGHGGFGITYLAQDTLLQEQVALKEFFPSDGAARVGECSVRARTQGEQPEFQIGLKSFLEEARLMARFRHRNIVYVRRFFEAHGTGYIVQDYERGDTLSKKLSNGPLQESELRAILSGVLSGLEALHERAVLHRDLKPDNIIVREDGSPVLIDFGAARDFAGRHSRSITAIASGGYTPPEQWGAGGQQGPWSDLYALGAIAYRCVTGAAPPVSLQRLRNDPLTPAAVAAAGKYDPRLLAAIDWMLKVDEEKRPASVAALREALETGAGLETVEQPLAALTIERTTAGGAILKFDRDIVSDLLELSIHATPPGAYLGAGTPAPGGSPQWSQSASVFSLYRSENARNAFALDPEVARQIPDGAQVRVASSDGFIRAAGAWPTAPALPPSQPVAKRNLARAAALVVGLLVAAAAAAGGYSFYTTQQAKNAEARRIQLLQQLEEARFDRPAIEQVLHACEPACAPDVKAAAQSKLDIINAEAQAFEAARDDLEKMRAYVSGCKACINKSEAQARVEALEAKAAAAIRSAEESQYLAARGSSFSLKKYLSSCKICAFAREAREEIAAHDRARFTKLLADAGSTPSALQQFIRECDASCPSDLKQQAQERLTRVEADNRERAARIASEDSDFWAASRANDVDRLRSYLSTCRECLHRDEARRKIADATDYFEFRACNHSGRKTSVAIAGTRRNDDKLRVVGWYNLTSGECKSLGTFKSGSFYYAAKAYDSFNTTWEGTLALCVTTRAFNRLNPPGYRCRRGERLLKFFSRNISGPSYTWTMNP